MHPNAGFCELVKIFARRTGVNKPTRLLADQAKLLGKTKEKIFPRALRNELNFSLLLQSREAQKIPEANEAETQAARFRDNN